MTTVTRKTLLALASLAAIACLILLLAEHGPPRAAAPQVSALEPAPADRSVLPIAPTAAGVEQDAQQPAPHAASPHATTLHSSESSSPSQGGASLSGELSREAPGIAPGSAPGSTAGRVSAVAAREALAHVGLDAQAERIWVDAINDPDLPAHARQDLIEDLNEEGFTDPKKLTEADLPLILRRIDLIERNAPFAMDEVNAAAFKEAHKDLSAMRQRLQRAREQAERPIR